MLSTVEVFSLCVCVCVGGGGVGVGGSGVACCIIERIFSVKGLLRIYIYPWQSSCSSERNGLSNVGRGSLKEHSFEIISKYIHWLMRRRRLNVFLFLALPAILFI